jgi:hypothetical protein
MGRGIVVALLALVGLLCAAGMGYGAYIVSRGSVAVPVTRLQPKPQLTPAGVRARPARRATTRAATTRATTTRATTTRPTTTVDDHGGRRGGGGDNSGRGGGGGGHGSDD